MMPGHPVPLQRLGCPGALGPKRGRPGTRCPGPQNHYCTETTGGPFNEPNRSRGGRAARPFAQVRTVLKRSLHNSSVKRCKWPTSSVSYIWGGRVQDADSGSMQGSH